MVLNPLGDMFPNDFPVRESCGDCFSFPVDYFGHFPDATAVVVFLNVGERVCLNRRNACRFGVGDFPRVCNFPRGFSDRLFG